MSLISLAAPLIRLAATDDDHAQELFDAVDPRRDPEGDREAFDGLIQTGVRPHELAALTSTQWQWFANWRQALGGQLDPVVLNYLTDSASTRFARFEVHALVLRDPSTNADSLEGDNLANRPDAIGLNWLSRQAKGARIIEGFDRIPDEALAEVFEQMADEVFELMRDEALELMRDALQCATEASWFLLRRLTSLNDDRGRSVSEWLRDFVRTREIEPRIWERWGLREPLGR
jgi:hypothetical protein